LEVMRILPRLNEDINEEWISDKARFAYDGLLKQRLDKPYIKKNGKLVAVSWDDAFTAIKNKINTLSGEKIAAIAGDLIDVEAMLALKDLWHKFGSDNIESRQYGEKFDVNSRSNYLFNTEIAGIDQADLCLIIGGNTRKDAPILNARIRKGTLSGKLKVSVIGDKTDLSYKYDYLGNDLSILKSILLGDHQFVEQLKVSQKPMLILGNNIVNLADGAEIINLCKLIAEKYNLIQEDWNGFNIIHTAAARVGALDIGFVPQNKDTDLKQILDKAEAGEIKLVYLLGADEFDVNKLKNSFVIYQGHHGDKGAHVADVILPGSAYTEKDATYVNLEGRVQRTYKAVSAPGSAKTDWQIIVELSKTLGNPLEYNDLKSIRNKMEQIAPHFAKIGCIEKSDWQKSNSDSNYTTKIISNIEQNYYLTDPICRVSVTMAKCASMFGKEN